MIEDFLNAIAQFKENKMRTILSLLGVIIGVMSVITITTIGQSATANVKESFGSSALDLIHVGAGFGRRSRNVSFELNETLRSEIRNSLPEIANIFYVNNVSASLRIGDTDASAQISAIESGYLEANKLEFAAGSFFTVTDFVDGMQHIVLGCEVAEVLFPDDAKNNYRNAIGQRITLDAGTIRFGFIITGILKECTSGMERPDQKAYVTRSFYQKKIDPEPDAAMMVVQVADQNNASKVGDAIKALAIQKTGNEYAVSIMSMQTMLEQYDKVTGTISLLLSGIAAISLLVGGIGIMNIMIVTVTERRKEIGIRKALGASQNAIKMQFLVESATVTLLGGVLGIAAGIGVSSIIVMIAGWNFAIQWKACLLAFVFSALVGVFFGLYPAIQASRLDPVDALASP